MSGTMPGLAKRIIPIPNDLYKRLSDSSTELVQRFYDLNIKKYSFWKAISPFRTKVEVNIAAASLVLEEKADLEEQRANWPFSKEDEAEAFRKLGEATLHKRSEPGTIAHTLINHPEIALRTGYAPFADCF